MAENESRKNVMPDSQGMQEAGNGTEIQDLLDEGMENGPSEKEAPTDRENPGKAGPKKKSWKEIATERREQLKEVTDRLEAGVRDYMANDEQFKKVLETMAKFHHYSARNILLITMQMPSATHVASYGNWQKKFNRQVKKGQKGLSIIIPAPYKKKTEREVTDPSTMRPVLDKDGNPQLEEVEVMVPHFKVSKVFDVSQTFGDPLPELDVPELTGNAENYQMFMDALREISPAPIRFDEIEGPSKGYYDSHAKEIVIRNGMSESQNMKTAVHEVAHARLHDRDRMAAQGIMKDQQTRETEAESIAYTVLSYYNLDTSDYSIPYLASWSGGMDTKALQASMDTIRITASEIIDDVDAFMKERMKERQTGLFTVYQLNDTEDTRPYLFESTESLKREGLKILPENYHEVYKGSLDPEETLEDLYIRFNQDKLPEDYHGHSLSVSDILVLHQNGHDHAWYVDSFGYTEVPEFLQERVSQKQVQDAGLEASEKTAMENDSPDMPVSPNTATGQKTTDENNVPETQSFDTKPAENLPERSISEKTATEGRLPEQAETELALRFYVAECMAFPVMGEYHDNLSLAQAAELYRNLPDSHMQGGKGIGCMVSDGNELAVRCSLMTDGQVKDDAFRELGQYRDAAILQAAIQETKEFFPSHTNASSHEKAVEVKNEPVHPDHAPQAYSAGHELASVDRKDPGAIEKSEPTGRKESVLAALRAHQKNLGDAGADKKERTREVQKKKGEITL